MADKKGKKKGSKSSGASFSTAGGLSGQVGRFSGSARFGGGVGMVGPGREPPPGGTPNAKKKTPMGTFQKPAKDYSKSTSVNVPTPKLNPRRGNR
jgi:hypothetical protein